MHSDVFSVIADPTRRRIVRILAEQTHTVGAVVEKLGMSQPTISKHLKVLRDADVVSVTVEGQRRLYSLNPDVFATVTEWINETVQIARQSSEAHVPVALPGGVTASASDKTAAEKPVEKTSEKSAPKPEATDSETFVVEAPTPEEIEQARIQRARAQHLTPSVRIYSRPAEHAADSAASEPVTEKAGAAEPTSQEEAADSTPMRPFTPASYGYDAGVTPAASASPAQPATPAAPAEVKPAETAKTTEAKPVVAHKPVVFPQPAAVVSYGTDPAAVVGGSIQPIAVIPEAVVLEKVADEKVAVEKPVATAESVTEETTGKEFAAEESASEDSAAEKSVIEKNVVDEAAAEEPVKAESAEEVASPAEATEKDELAKGEPANDELAEGEPTKAETSAEEPEYQTMPAYDSVYRPNAETTNTEAKDNHRGGLFGFLRGRRR